MLFLTSSGDTACSGRRSRRCRARLLSTIVSGPAGRLADRFGHRAVIVPGRLLRGRGDGAALGRREPDWLGLWLPGACLTGIGIGLAFPTLGSAAVRDVPDDRFATASAVNAAFRQVGAVLGTAILVAIVGEPASLAEALPVADRASCSPRFASLLAGAVTLDFLHCFGRRFLPSPIHRPEAASRRS